MFLPNPQASPDTRALVSHVLAMYIYLKSVGCALFIFMAYYTTFPKIEFSLLSICSVNLSHNFVLSNLLIFIGRFSDCVKIYKIIISKVA